MKKGLLTMAGVLLTVSLVSAGTTVPVLAEEETSRINVIGSASFGNPMASAIGDKKLQRISKAPLERRIPTATISPISVGNIS